ncbi:MAG: TetR/AcrR family transcriptional regulator [Actinomycetota bacterium]|nr:TetR/AcrR family transcriptional regulator [Actinomycetota bacterium]
MDRSGVVDGRPRSDRPDRRMVDAALACIARWGVDKTTLDDVARQAGCARATVYRSFPGGKEALLRAAVTQERRRFGDGLAAVLSTTDDLESLLVDGTCYAARFLAEHGALRTVLAQEPERVLPHVAFAGADRLLAEAAALVGPHLEAHLSPALAARAAEWVTRLVLSYALAPSPTVDLTDTDCTRRLVRTFVLPALRPPTRGEDR